MSRPPVESNVAEPSDGPPDRVAFLDAELASGARVRESAQKVSPPSEVGRSSPSGLHGGCVPVRARFPVVCGGYSVVLKEVEPAPWGEVEFEIGRRRYDAQYSAAWRLFETFVPIGCALGPAY